MSRLAHPDRLAQRLREQGLPADAAAAKARLFARAAAALGSSDRPLAGRFVPGRIEVLGKHTDYCGGSSLVAAIDRGVCLVFRARDDAQIEIADVLRNEAVSFQCEPQLTPPLGHWSNYPLTVARRLARNFSAARRGADMALASDLPPAAGMSSSSALMVAVALALLDVNRLWNDPQHGPTLADPLALAGYLATVENGQSFGALPGDRGVGTFGGSEDHTAILCARPGQISQYAYCPVRFQQQFPLPAGHVCVIGASGVAAEKTGAAREQYNRASRLASELIQLWRMQTGRGETHLAQVTAGGQDAIDRLRAIVGRAQSAFTATELEARLAHFVLENTQIIPAAGGALLHGDVAEFGQQTDHSQRASEELLGNQVPETIRLAASARRLGAAAASAFGAGFGGSVWALVAAAAAHDFLEAWSADYLAAFPARAAAAVFFPTTAGPAAFRVDDLDTLL